MLLSEYRPKSRLVTKQTRVERARYPVIDCHNHLGGDFGPDWVHQPLDAILAAMDAVNVRVLVDLDGGWGENILDEHMRLLKGAPERFVFFGGVDWSKWPEKGDDFGEWAASRLRAQVNRGARGLKIWKVLGLHVRDQNGVLVGVDDPRLDPLWKTAAELKLPVLIHVADPVAFFDPLGPENERWEEMSEHPDWQFPSPPFPAFLTVVNGLANLVARHAQTNFIGAHVGCYAENLGWVSDLMDHCPNFYVDMSARVGELGRQPYAARKFFMTHADRIVFGLDLGINAEAYRIQFRFLETDDEYFDYGTGETPGQGRWQVYGLYLPDDVLAKVYYQNAENLLGVKVISNER